MSSRRTVDRHVLYLGEINDSQRAAWLKSIEAFDETRGSQRWSARQDQSYLALEK